MDNDDFLTQIKDSLARFGESVGVKTTAQKREDDERQDFLSRFRGIAQKEIIPVMSLVAEQATNFVRIAIEDKPDLSSITFMITCDTKGTIEKRFVSFAANWKTKMVDIETENGVGPAQQSMSEALIKQAFVQDLIDRVLRTRSRRQ